MVKEINFDEVMLKVQLMDDGKVVKEKRNLVKGWKNAKKSGAMMLKNSKVESNYVRIYDPEDVTDIDFITRDRMKTRRYIPEEQIEEGEE